LFNGPGAKPACGVADIEKKLQKKREEKEKKKA